MTQALKPLRPLRTSCLVNALEPHLDLTDAECDALARFERVATNVSKGHELVPAGERLDRLFVIADGWAIGRGTAPAGRSHAFRLYLPGEMVGLADIAARTARHGIRMQTDGVVYGLTRGDIASLFVGYPRLAALLLSLASMNAMALSDHAVALAAMDGETRLKTFLLSLRARLHKGGIGVGDRIRVPLNQAEIGELSGMTPIYVNRLLRRWVRANELSIERPYFRFHTREAWEAEIRFVDPYERIDTSWFPAA